MDKTELIAEQLTDVIREIPPEQQDLIFHQFAIRIAHILKRNPKIRAAYPEEWKKHKHLCMEFDVLGYHIRMRKTAQTPQLAAA